MFIMLLSNPQLIITPQEHLVSRVYYVANKPSSDHHTIEKNMISSVSYVAIKPSANYHTT